MEKHYLEFEDSEENKLSYTSIFNDYVSHGVSWNDTGRLIAASRVIVAPGLGSSGGYGLLFVQISLLEKHLEQQLTLRIPGFNMNNFTELLM